MGNLHNFGLSMAVYASDHDGTFPETLDELYPIYVASLQTFACPDDGSSMTICEDIESSYHFLGSVSRGMWSPDLIVAYDKAGNHLGWRNGLFADSHVQKPQEWNFTERCQQNLEQLKASEGWGKLSQERRKQIEAFYSDALTAFDEPHLPAELGAVESAIEQTGVLLPLCDKLIGEPPAKVKVIAALPVAAMYKDYVGLYLASVSQKFPSMVSLRIANMGSEQGRQVMKGNCLECATVLINGKSAFDFGEAPGDKLQLKGPELSAPGVRRALAAGLKEVYGDSVPELPPLPPEE